MKTFKKIYLMIIRKLIAIFTKLFVRVMNIYIKGKTK